MSVKEKISSLWFQSVRHTVCMMLFGGHKVPFIALTLQYTNVSAKRGCKFIFRQSKIKQLQSNVLLLEWHEIQK